MMKMKIVRFVAPVLLAGLTACGSTAHPVTDAHRVTATPWATTRTDLAPSTIPAQPQQPSAMDNWCFGQGFQNLVDVARDLIALNTDLGNGEYGSAESDGSNLAVAGVAAQRTSPPFSQHRKTEYGEYMVSAVLLGSEASTGDFAQGAAAWTYAAPYSGGIQAIINQCEAVNPMDL